MRIIILLFALVFVFSGCVNGAVKNNNFSDNKLGSVSGEGSGKSDSAKAIVNVSDFWKEYSDPEAGFSFKYLQDILLNIYDTKF